MPDPIAPPTSVIGRRAAFVSAIGLFVLLAAGCGGGSTAESGSAASTQSTVGASPSTGGGSSSPSGSGTVSDTDTCSLLSAAQASSLTGQTYSAATPETIATGQDQCTYAAANNGSDLTVIVYQPSSGVTFDTLKSVQTSVGQVTTLSGVGDQAIIGLIELDAQVGTRLIAIEGAGGNLTGDSTKAIAVANAIIAALH